MLSYLKYVCGYISVTGLLPFTNNAHKEWSTMTRDEQEEWNKRAEALEDPDVLAARSADDLHRKQFIEKTLARIYKDMKNLGKHMMY